VYCLFVLLSAYGRFVPIFSISAEKYFSALKKVSGRAFDTPMPGGNGGTVIQGGEKNILKRILWGLLTAGVYFFYTISSFTARGMYKKSWNRVAALPGQNIKDCLCFVFFSLT